MDMTKGKRKREKQCPSPYRHINNMCPIEL